MTEDDRRPSEPTETDAPTETGGTGADRRPRLPGARYRELLEEFGRRRQREERRSRALSWVRLGVFLALVTCLLASVIEAGGRPVGWLAGAAAALVVFAGLVVAHDPVLRRERRFRELETLNREALARLARRWDELPLPTLPPSLPAPAFARDLDLFGHASLLQLLGTAQSPPGKTTLARWLLEPAAPEEVRRRQEAVEELAGDIGLRQELALATRLMDAVDPDAERFLRWAEADPWLLGRRWLVRASWLLPALVLGLVAAWALGRLPGSLVALALVGSYTVSHLTAERVEHLLGQVSSGEGEFGSYAASFRLLEGRRFASPLLRGLVADLSAGGVSAYRQMDLLHRRVVLADARHSATLRFLLDTLLVWDLHMLRLLERWQVAAGRRARRWLEALGELEALAALGELRFAHPGWVLPLVEPEGPARFEAEGLAHPLLPPEVRVGNDVGLGPPGTFLLVTGSNMSGKSTLLRSIGVNLVLAQAGGPVCASRLVVSPLALATSVLVEDSLESGLSFFMAELLRIKQVVDAARASRREQGRPLLYLLDEVLRGTNAAERQIAVGRVLAHLLGEGAIGAVATHDLGIARLPGLERAVVPVHFRETLGSVPGGGPTMSFDYRLRPGIATTTNALKLLELVGLGDVAQPASEPLPGGGS